MAQPYDLLRHYTNDSFSRFHSRRSHQSPKSSSRKSSSKSSKHHVSNLAEDVKKSSEKSADESNKHTASSKSKGPLKPVDNDDRTGVPASALPNPMPASGSDGVHASASTSSLPSLLAGHGVGTTLIATATFSPSSSVPSYSANSAHISSPTSMHSSVSSSITGPSEVVQANEAQKQSSSHLSTALISVLAVGAAFVLAGVLIAIKAYSRPRRRSHPTPSLPVLQDGFEDKYADDTSPVFGGKERFSAPGTEEVKGNAELWRWTQYSAPGLAKPAPTAALGRASLLTGSAVAYGNPGKSLAPGESGNRNAGGNAEKTSSSKDEPLTAASSRTAVGVKYPPPAQQARGALPRAISRVSAASMSVYPASPNVDVGLAIDGTTSYTADGLPILTKHSRDASRSAPRKISRSSTFGGHDAARDTTLSRYSSGLAYENVDVGPVQFQTAKHVKLPTMPSVSKVAANPGRARIKSTYFAPGTLPSSRFSETSLGPDAFSRQFDQFDLNSTADKVPLPRSESRRDRETKALTSAMGLTTPELPYLPTSHELHGAEGDLKSSSSRSRGGGSRRSIGPKKSALKRRSVAEGSPGLDGSASLGSLMLADYDAEAPSGGGGSADLSRGARGRRTDEKPPRVPSPPPLPSLSQMGLRHENPEDFDNYRSPTYSIYDLYNGDRKSKRMSMRD